ncbi:hypothetical protein [Vibrio sp. R78045]|uniref:hypothetical protein n=1 Tax=Vibrio sp. R78045 TaxID=3093868 RepID=UPI0036F3A7A9
MSVFKPSEILETLPNIDCTFSMSPLNSDERPVAIPKPKSLTLEVVYWPVVGSKKLAHFSAKAHEATNQSLSDLQRLALKCSNVSLVNVI